MLSLFGLMVYLEMFYDLLELKMVKLCLYFRVAHSTLVN